MADAPKEAATAPAKLAGGLWNGVKKVGKGFLGLTFNRVTLSLAAGAAVTAALVTACPAPVLASTISNLAPIVPGAGIIENSTTIISNGASLAKTIVVDGSGALWNTAQASVAAAKANVAITAPSAAVGMPPMVNAPSPSFFGA